MVVEVFIEVLWVFIEELKSFVLLEDEEYWCLWGRNGWRGGRVSTDPQKGTPNGPERLVQVIQ